MKCVTPYPWKVTIFAKRNPNDFFDILSRLVLLRSERGLLPALEKREQIFLSHTPCSFKLSLSAAIKKRSIFVQQRQRWHALLERYPIFLCQIQVLICFADVHVHQFEAFFHDLSRCAFVQRAIKHVTVVTPVAAEDEQYSFVVMGCSFQGRVDFFLRVGVCGIEISLSGRRLKDVTFVLGSILSHHGRRKC
jgi:hypothetical protein